MLIHGTGDDNANHQNCERLVNELIRYGKIFSQSSNPMRTHSIHEGSPGTTYHLRKSMADYCSLRICRLEEDKLYFLKETIHKDAILFQALLSKIMASCYFSYTFLPTQKMPWRFRKNALTFKIKRLNVLILRHFLYASAHYPKESGSQHLYKFILSQHITLMTLKYFQTACHIIRLNDYVRTVVLRKTYI